MPTKSEQVNATDDQDVKPKKLPTRLRNVQRVVTGGCQDCAGDTELWHGPNAHGVAVRHHDATSHETFVKVRMEIRYGIPPDKRPKKPKKDKKRAKRGTKHAAMHTHTTNRQGAAAKREGR